MKKIKIDGFTLIELVIVIIITGILAASITSLISQGSIAYLTAQNITDADWQARLAIERMVRDIRAIRSSADISTASATQLTFTDFGGTSISYTLSGTSLLRNSQILADGISALSFTYYDENGASGASAITLRYVKIALTITQKNTNFQIITMVNPRNLS